MDQLDGRVVVVTGGGSGIGRGIARTFGAEGMAVAVVYIQESKARGGGSGDRGGLIMIRAIRANRLHVLTHPKARRLIEGRFQAMLEDFDFAAGGRGADPPPRLANGPS